MMRSIKWRRWLPLAFVAIMVALVVTACGEDKKASPSSAFCGYIYGNGEGKHDNNRHYTLLPGQSRNYRSDQEIARYVPCNPRNYYALPEGQSADRHNPSLARTTGGKTTSGTPVRVWWRMYWRLNQNEKPLNNFADVCAKYRCFSDQPVGGEQHSSTPGWNDMLGETFSPTGDQVAYIAMAGYTDKDGKKHAGFDDTIWENQSPDDYAQLATNMAQLFMEKVQATTGFNDDLFCGSSSNWTTQNGKRVFDCKTVFFVIDSVEPVNQKLKETAVEQKQEDKQATLNQKRAMNAKLLYGDFAPYFLGLQDTCKGSSTCVINLAGTSVPVSVTKK